MGRGGHSRDGVWGRQKSPPRPVHASTVLLTTHYYSHYHRLVSRPPHPPIAVDCTLNSALSGPWSWSWSWSVHKLLCSKSSSGRTTLPVVIIITRSAIPASFRQGGHEASWQGCRELHDSACN